MRVRSFSLPLRLSLAVSIVLVVTTVLADIMAMRSLRLNLTRSVSASLSGMVERMAAQLDRDLEMLLGFLESEARQAEGMEPAAAAGMLARQGAALELVFDYGVLVVDASGRVVADSRGRGWNGVSMAGEEFFQRGFALGRPLVSEPFVSPGPEGALLVVVAAPLRDGDGRMRAILAGGLDLRRNRILNQSTDVRAGRTGQIGIFTRDGRVVAHSDAGILLEQYENPLPERPSDAGAVMEITVAGGGEALLAASFLKNADWVLAGVFPKAEVYAPIDSGFAAAHLWFGLGLAASCLLVWLIAWRAVRDIGMLAREVAAIGPGGEPAGTARAGGQYRGEAGMMAGAVNHMLDSLESARREIDDLSLRLADAGERERRSIAADLHDSVCQSLALANMRLGGIRKRLPETPEAESLAGIGVILEGAVAELRNLTFDLSPGILYELGLVPALEWQGREFAERHGMAVSVKGEGDLEGMDEGLAIFLYRSVGELETNAAKHSGGDRVEVAAARDGGDVVVTVGDDGKGMAGAPTDGKGFGLRNLRQRTRQFGGRLVIGEREGGGAQATLRVPFLKTGDTQV